MQVRLTSMPRFAMLSLAALVIANLGACQKFRLLDINVKAPDNVTINGVSDEVTATHPAIYTYISPRLPLHENFEGVVGVYLPLEVQRFQVKVSLFSVDCRVFTGIDSFDVGSATLSLELGPPQPDPTCDGGQGDGDGDVVFVADAADAIEDVGDAEAPDAGVDAPPDGSTCFDPTADAGAPIPLTVAMVNPACNQYCEDVTTACPSAFSDADSCRILCTRAGWQQAEAGGDNVILTCLDTFATMTPPDCAAANPSYAGVCFDRCQVYCNFQATLCGHNPETYDGCFSACSNLQLGQLTCLLEVLVHDVPADPRFCSWTGGIDHCGRCSP